MLIDLDNLSTAQTYFTMTQTVIPRPIAWILTENQKGNYNLAPFSYFNAVCSDPPLVAFSIGLQQDGTSKDTLVNLSARPQCVVHIASCDQLAVLNQTSATLPPGESEVLASHIDLIDQEGFSIPRIADCKIAFMCDIDQIQEIGNHRQSLIFARILCIYIEDSCTGMDSNGRLKVDATKILPLARLGASQYVSFGEVLSIQRPR